MYDGGIGGLAFKREDLGPTMPISISDAERIINIVFFPIYPPDFTLDLGPKCSSPRRVELRFVDTWLLYHKHHS